MATKAASLSPIAETERVAESPFYIPMTGPAARPRCTLKHGDTFVVFDSHGDIGVTTGGPDGCLFEDTRFLSRLEMSLNGMHPLLLGSNIRDDNCFLTVDLTNPDIYFARPPAAAEKDTLHIVRTVFLWRGTRTSGSRCAIMASARSRPSISR